MDSVPCHGLVSTYLLCTDILINHTDSTFTSGRDATTRSDSQGSGQTGNLHGRFEIVDSTDPGWGSVRLESPDSPRPQKLTDL